MFDASTLGEVSVEVRANLDQLLRDYARGKTATHAFERDLKGVTTQTRAYKNATDDLSRKLGNLAKSGQPLGYAMMRHERDLLRLQRLSRQLSAGGGLVPPVGPINKSGQAIGGLTAPITRVGAAASVARGFIGGFVAAVGVGLATKLADVAVNSLKATAAIKDVAKQTGLTTTELQEYRGIAGDVGLTTEQMDSAFVQFNDTVGKAAAGAARESKLFNLLGISLKDAGGNAKTSGALFGEFVDKMGQVGNEAQRAAALSMVFGETLGPKMAQLIGVGTTKINELREAIADTGMVLSEDEIQKADETARKLEQVKNVLNAKIASTVVDNAEAISTLANALAAVASAAITAAGAMATFFSELGKGGKFDISGWGGPSLAGNAKDGRTRGMMVKPGQAVPMRSVKGKYYDPTDFSLRDFPKGGGKGGIDLSSLLAPKGRTGRKSGAGRKAPDNIFEREELQAQQERLRLLRDSTASLEERNRIDHELIGLALSERKEQIDKQQADGKLTKAQAAQLKAAEDERAQMEREAADRQLRMDQIEQRTQVASELMQAEQAALDVQHRLARTQDDKTRIEASLLQLKQREELLELDKQIALAQEAEDTKRIAELTELRRRALEKQGAESKAFTQEHLRGIEKFRNDLPKTVKEINEAIEDIRFDLFTERLQQAAQFARDVGDAFGNAAARIANFENPLDVVKGLLQDLSRTLTEQFITKPVSNWATKNIGLPLAKETMGKGLTGPDALTVEQMNLALDLATQNLNALSSAAMSASASMGGGGAGAAQAADALGQSATATEQSFSSLDPQLAQFGSGLMSVLSGLGGGGGSGLMGFLKMGLGLAAGAFGGGGAAAGGGFGSLPGALSFNPGGSFLGGGAGFVGGFAGGGWIGGHGTGRSDSMWLKGSRGEHMTNADAASRFGPVLDGINSGRIPDMPALAGVLGGTSIFSPTIQMGAPVFPGIRDSREARRATRQASSDIQREVARGLRAGYLNE